jgi:hypothetical protein
MCEQNQNTERDFIALSGRQNQICKFFLLGTCKKGKACTFSHVQNKEVVLNPLQQIINEIEISVARRQLSNIFAKMLTNKDDYIKYYNEIHMKFRGYSVMKLKKQSIVDTFLGHENKQKHTFDESIFKYRNLKLDTDITLSYGFIPFLFHFFIMGFAWNTFQGAKDMTEEGTINECYDEFVAQLQKRYSDKEYDNIVREACEFVDPVSKENMIMVASHYLCDRVVVDIKDVFKKIKRRNYTVEELSEERLEIGEDNFNKFINEEFTAFINDEYNALKENAFHLFSKRKDNPEIAYQKYQEKKDKSIFRARGDVKIIADANQRYDYNISQYRRKVNIFYNSIFNDNISRKKLILADINWDAIFLSKLSMFIGAKNKFGTRCNPDVLSELLRILSDELSTKKDTYIKMIIKIIPNDLMNASQIIKVFKDKNVIDYLWNDLLASITAETLNTFCPELLKEFLNESSRGLQEAYTSQYAMKIDQFKKEKI